MKTFKIAFLVAILLSVPALAFENKIATCFGDHHGSYLDIIYTDSEQTSYLMFHIYTDADEAESPTRKYRLTSFTKGGEIVLGTAKVLAVKNAIETATRYGSHEDTIIATGQNLKNDDSNITINLKTRQGKHYLQYEDGYIEELSCQIVNQ